MALAAYYLLGGGYSMQLDSHVRMDVLYSRWSPKTKAVLDCITAIGLVAYLVVLLYGGVSSTQYALEYSQKNYSVWGPPLAPIKIAHDLRHRAAAAAGGRLVLQGLGGGAGTDPSHETRIH